jgi:hypothetical protein
VVCKTPESNKSQKRSKSAKTLAHLYKLHDKESGGYIWGQSLVLLLFVTPKITIPMGFTFYKPAPELSAWYKQERTLKQQGVPKKQRPPQPPPNPQYPTKQDLALHLLQQCKDQHPALTVHCIVADALYGTSTFVDTASAIFHGVQVISQVRSNQKIRVYTHEQHVADYFATHPGTPQKIRIRGGDEIVAIVGSARVYVCAHHTKRFIIALKYEVTGCEFSGEHTRLTFALVEAQSDSPVGYGRKNVWHAVAARTMKCA